MSAEALDAILAGDRIADPAELSAISAFFGVAAEYLLTDGPVPKIESQLNLLEILRDAGATVETLYICNRWHRSPS